MQRSQWWRQAEVRQQQSEERCVLLRQVDIAGGHGSSGVHYQPQQQEAHMAHTTVRPVFTVALTARMTRPAARASRPAGMVAR